MSDLDQLRPQTLAGMKSLAWDIKRRDGIKVGQALQKVARQCGYNSWQHACEQLK